MSHDRIAQVGYNGTVADMAPETHVVPGLQRRRFTVSYKLRILQEADLCKASGQIGALLRREGLYSSNLSVWRRQRERGELSSLSPAKRGPKVDEAAEQIEKLKRENARLKKRLDKAEIIIDVQKKLSMLLGLVDPEPKSVDK